MGVVDKIFGALPAEGDFGYWMIVGAQSIYWLGWLGFAHYQVLSVRNIINTAEDV